MKSTMTVITVLVLIALIVAGIWTLRYHTAEIRGIISGEERIESAQSRISRYEEFFSLCAQVKTQKSQLKAQKQRLEDTEDDATRERVRSNIAGLKGQIARTVNTYNSRATQSYTSARFHDSDLPYQLSKTGETQCAAN